jgi:DNA-binding response OmpR family regulator
VNKGKHILVADDEAEFRFAVSVALRGAGYRVTEADDGLQALDQAVRGFESGNPVDMLVTDICMPNCSGEELISELRRLAVPISIFVVTGSFDSMLHPKLEDMERTAYIEKPFRPEELVRRIGLLLGNGEGDFVPSA